MLDLGFPALTLGPTCSGLPVELWWPIIQDSETVLNQLHEED